MLFFLRRLSLLISETGLHHYSINNSKSKSTVHVCFLLRCLFCKQACRIKTELLHFFPFIVLKLHGIVFIYIYIHLQISFLNFIYILKCIWREKCFNGCFSLFLLLTTGAGNNLRGHCHGACVSIFRAGCGWWRRRICSGTCYKGFPCYCKFSLDKHSLSRNCCVHSYNCELEFCWHCISPALDATIIFGISNVKKQFLDTILFFIFILFININNNSVYETLWLYFDVGAMVIGKLWDCGRCITAKIYIVCSLSSTLCR